jgi:hypothetical protein
MVGRDRRRRAADQGGTPVIKSISPVEEKVIV